MLGGAAETRAVHVMVPRDAVRDVVADVVLVHGYGWPQAEVAALLEVGPSTVHEHLNRALARLRADLEDHDDR